MPVRFRGDTVPFTKATNNSHTSVHSLKLTVRPSENRQNVPIKGNCLSSKVQAEGMCPNWKPPNLGFKMISLTFQLGHCAYKFTLRSCFLSYSVVDLCAYVASGFFTPHADDVIPKYI